MRMSNPAYRRCFHHDQLLHSLLMFYPCSIKRRQFATQRHRFRRIDAELDQFFSSAGIPGEEIYSQITPRLYVGDIGAAPLQFIEDNEFEGVAGIRAAARIEGLNQPRIDGVQFAGIGVAASFRVGGYGDSGQQECIDEVAGEVVYRGFADRVAQRSKIVVETVDAEAAAQTSQRMPRDPAQRGHLCHAVPLHDVAKEDRIDVSLQQRDPRLLAGYARRQTRSQAISHPIRQSLNCGRGEAKASGMACQE